MKTSDAIKHFGSRIALARVMKVSRQTVWNWERKGKLPAMSALACRYLMANRPPWRRDKA